MGGKVKSKKLRPRDADGRRIRVGDTVRIVAVPEFEGWGAEAVGAIFSHILGNYKRVSGFDERGELEFCIQIRKSRRYLPAGVHCISLEPGCTRVKSR